MYMAQPCQCTEEIPRSSSIRYAKGYAYVSRLQFAKMNSRKGFGTLLMEEAERIAREEHESIKIAVISGKLGYGLQEARLIANFLVPPPPGRCGHARLLSKIRV